MQCRFFMHYLFLATIPHGVFRSGRRPIARFVVPRPRCGGVGNRSVQKRGERLMFRGEAKG